MPRVPQHRPVSLALVVTAAITALVAAVPLTSTAQTTQAIEPTASRAAEPHARISTAYELPGDRVYPEGIAADPRTGDLYAGSYADGTVFKMTPGRRVAEEFLPAGADGRRTTNGLKVDRSGRLWVIDSTSGVSVYDVRSRRLLARFDVPGQSPGHRPGQSSGQSSDQSSGQSSGQLAIFVNDLALTQDGTAYLTDSRRAVVYRVTPHQLAQAQANGGRATLTPRFDLSTVLEPHAPDAYSLNGIVADPSGRYLLTVDMTGGDLYRLDLASGGIRQVALHGGDMLHADGLELRHGRLWAVHNTDHAISRWRVTRDGFAARAERRVTDQALQLPTTLVRRHGTLYVVRSQFDKGGPMGPGTPQIPFTIASVHGI
ncbi:SMP-30/gluconolactonase/LRE family protein [Streptomyces sp. 7N604]|uniref:SMP-30/gluconolactonase/LRE family protein n=1 Tax=Streptomyces sp. 7N604 TaxID=3457415 RepID=UPI003FD18BD0